jgi:hypothetical protein
MIFGYTIVHLVISILNWFNVGGIFRCDYYLVFLTVFVHRRFAASVNGCLVKIGGSIYIYR